MASIYNITVTCVFGISLKTECVRVIEVESSFSLEDLHFEILHSVGFDDDHLYDFFLANSPRGVREVIVEQDDYGDSDYSIVLLDSVFPTGRKRLYYLFDYGDNWLFEIRKSRGEKEKDSKFTYPRVVDKRGPNPEQYPASDFY
jgi:Plasmid pRiA4b ORF-3-like protein